jgi:hypothetical protein
MHGLLLLLAGGSRQAVCVCHCKGLQTRCPYFVSTCKPFAETAFTILVPECGARGVLLKTPDFQVEITCIQSFRPVYFCSDRASC